MGGLSYKPGASVRYLGKTWRIVQSTDLSSVLLESPDGGEAKVAHVSKLKPVEEVKPEDLPRFLDALADDDADMARKRFAIIKPLVRCARRSEEDVARVSEANGIGKSTIYRWIRLYEGRRLVSDLAPRRKGRKMPRTLDPRVEAVIESAIQDYYLTRQKPSGSDLILEVQRRCRKAGLPKPSKNTVRRRLRDVHPRERTLKREGQKAARDRFGAIRDRFPGADFPLAVVQIDHTQLDIILVDEEKRVPIGRPWLTLAIDVYSRMVVGYHLSLDHPGAFAVGLCLTHGMLLKDEELTKLGIKGDWPVWGKPRMVHADNGKDFRSHLIEDALNEHDIAHEFRPPKTPHYGGHIERLMGTLAKKIHTLPGATFSNPRQRGEYDSAGKAAITLNGLRRWLLNFIVGAYHNTLHEGIGMPPIARWREGIEGNENMVGIGMIEPIADPRRLQLDFLPYTEREVQRQGIVWDNIWYHSHDLEDWIRLPGDRRREKFKVRRDPTDISSLYFFDPRLKDYVKVPYRDTQYPSISLWDYKAVRAWLRERGQAAVDERAIFVAYEEMHRIVSEEQTETKRARRAHAKLTEKRRRRSEISLDPPTADKARAPAAETLQPTRRKAPPLKLVTSNGKPTDEEWDLSDVMTEGKVERW